MPPNPSQTQAPTLFPYNAGPKVRGFTTSLLFHDNVNVCLSGWVSNNPLEAFYSTGARAQEVGHALSRLMDFVYHHFHTAQDVTLREVEHLKPLRGRISNIFLVQPGTPEAYSRWEPFHVNCLPIAVQALENIHVLHASIIEFVFRVYELYLIEGEDPDRVLARLYERAKVVGGEFNLLAECALHRFSIPSHGFGEWITDLPHIPAVLEEISKKVATPEDINEIRSSGLAFQIFDYLLKPYTPRLDEAGIERVTHLFENHESELIQMRAKCATEAFALVQSEANEAQTKDIVNAALLRFEDEVREIAEINRSTFREMVTDILGDNTSWATFAGFVGAGVAGMPASLVASLGIAAFSTLGANAFKARSKRDKKLKSSPWTFVHYVNS